ncbi:MAG TPA: sulfatase [Actinomycetota bacterium]|nr:sulfatase [Actinomycetota bacterium]
MPTRTTAAAAGWTGEGAALKRWLAVGLAVLLGAVALRSIRPAPAERRPNILLILTDDQSLDTLPSSPAAMPFLQSQLADPAGHWLRFPNAVVPTPLCCPSRATLLTGRYDVHTGVRNNSEGPNLDDANTLPVWLHDAGYTTGLVGKYLNDYPFARAPFIPPGWDRWFAKENTNESTAYFDYDVVDQGGVRHYGHAPEDYATDVLGGAAAAFLRAAPRTSPWFLYFAPNAPHAPSIPAPRYADAFPGYLPPLASPAELNDVRGKPAYVRRRPPVGPTLRAELQQDELLEWRSLRSVDDAIRVLFGTIRARGELDDTVIVFLTDNGFEFGQHRLTTKRFPYEPSIGVPFAIRTPWASAATLPTLVSNLDLASTVAALAGVEPGLPQDGISLAPLVYGRAPPPREGVWLDWGGDAQVPAWTGVRTPTFTFVRNADGTQELYVHATDPGELRNLASGSDAALLERARSTLERLAPAGAGV